MLDWESVPDWLAGIAATLALIFAYFAVRAANTQLQMAQRDRQRAQAERVGAWLSRDDEGRHYYNFANTSDLPVHSFNAAVWRIGDPDQKGTRISWQWLAPRTIQVPVEHPEWICNHDLFLEISFRDNAARHWPRHRTGVLRPFSNQAELLADGDRIAARQSFELNDPTTAPGE